jgi:hypothetical protein
MKTIVLISSVILAGLLLAPTSQAAPSCCASTQGQAGVFSSAPVGQAYKLPSVPPLVKGGKGGFDRQTARPATTFPVAQRNAYLPPASQTHRRVAPVPRNARLPQASPAHYPPPIAPVAAAPGACGCGARFRAANYPAPSVSCCSVGGLNVPRQAVAPSRSSVPSCCAVPAKPAAPVASCCAVEAKAAPTVPSCCAVGPKTAGPAPRLAKGALRTPDSVLPLHAQPAVIPVGFHSNLASTMEIRSNGTPVLRFGSLW